MPAATISHGMAEPLCRACHRLTVLFDNLWTCALTMTLKQTRLDSTQILAFVTCRWDSSPAFGLATTGRLFGNMNSLMSAMKLCHSGNYSWARLA